MKLNLGAGEQPLPGYQNLDIKTGDSIFPLAVADGAAEEIRASHCLEHFDFATAPKVLAEWVRALAPGGTLKIAVPDFRKVAERYLAGEVEPTGGYVMGGQTDPNDYHKAVFDRPSLTKLFSDLGLVLIEEWRSEIEDAASLPISLNLAARKPRRPAIKVVAAMTTPRLGFNDMWQCAVRALPRLGIELIRTGGAFWGQHLTRGIEKGLAEHRPDYLLTIDYDSVFTAPQLARLMQLACLYPDAGAILPLQLGRGDIAQVFNLDLPEGAKQNLREARPEDGAAVVGQKVYDLNAELLAPDLVPLTTGHFGLTLIDAAKLTALPQPWFLETPAPDGGWGPGRIDPDIHFWRKWREAGHTAMLATRVAIGHLELCVKWPDEALQPLMQPCGDWEATGVPARAWKGV